MKRKIKQVYEEPKIKISESLQSNYNASITQAIVSGEVAPGEYKKLKLNSDGSLVVSANINVENAVEATEFMTTVKHNFSSTDEQSNINLPSSRRANITMWRYINNPGSVGTLTTSKDDIHGYTITPTSFDLDVSIVSTRNSFTADLTQLVFTCEVWDQEFSGAQTKDVNCSFGDYLAYFSYHSLPPAGAPGAPPNVLYINYYATGSLSTHYSDSKNCR